MKIKFAVLLFLIPMVALSFEALKPIENALAKKDWDSAIDLAEDYIDQNPKSSLAHYYLAKGIRIKMQSVSRVRAMFSLDDYKEALEKAISLDPKNLDAREEQIGFYLFSPSIAGGDKEVAKQKIIELKSIDSISGLEQEVKLESINKNLVRVESLYEELIDKSPKQLKNYIELAQVKIELKKYKSAEDLLLKLIEKGSTQFTHHAQYQRARWRILANQENELAISLLDEYQIASEKNKDKLVTYLPLYAIYWRKGLAYENLGNTKKAIEYLNKSLAKNDDFEPAKSDFKRLRK